MIAWHYTHGRHISNILGAGVIKPADIGIVHGEKPVVWFSLNQFWEETVVKGWLPHGGGPQRDLRMGGLHETFGIYRIGVSLETASLTWDDIKRLSGMPQQVISGLQRVARKWGARPNEWRGTFEPVTRDKWVAVEVFDDSRWVTFSGGAL